MVNQQNRSNMVRRAAGIAALAVLAVSCGGSSDGEEAASSTPATEGVEAPASAAPTTVAAPVTEAPAVEEPVDVADIPAVPCAEYVAETGYPLKPCDSGVLVETLQRDLESLFPTIAIDGLYGGQTFGFIQQIQTASGTAATGLVSEALAQQIASAETLDALGDGVVTTADPDADEAAADVTEGDGDDLTTEQVCNDLIGNPEAEELTGTMIETCADLGIDIVGEG